MALNLAGIFKKKYRKPSEDHTGEPSSSFGYSDGLNLVGLSRHSPSIKTTKTRVKKDKVLKQLKQPSAKKTKQPKKDNALKKNDQSDGTDPADMLGESQSQKDLETLFQWNSKLSNAFKDANLVPDQKCSHCHVFGHYEFAGGGGAEIATSAIASASGGSMSTEVVTQADWDTCKLKSLKMNMESCRFKNIMDVVDCKEKIENGCMEEVVWSQEDILSALGLRRCRLGEHVSDSSFSQSSSDSSDHSSADDVSDCLDECPESESGSLAPSTDESVATDTNNDFFIEEDTLRTRLSELFDKKQCLKRPVGKAEEGWKIISAVSFDDQSSALNMDTEMMIWWGTVFILCKSFVSFLLMVGKYVIYTKHSKQIKFIFLVSIFIFFKDGSGDGPSDFDSILNLMCEICFQPFNASTTFNFTRRCFGLDYLRVGF